MRFGNASATFNQGFMQKLAMNEMLRQQEQERQRQMESIRNMFSALGFQPPQGYMEPQQAGAVVGELGDRQRETSAEKRRQDDLRRRGEERNQERTWEVEDMTTKRTWNTQDYETRRTDQQAEYQTKRKDEIADDTRDFQQQKDLVTFRDELDIPKGNTNTKILGQQLEREMRGIAGDNGKTVNERYEALRTWVSDPDIADAIVALTEQDKDEGNRLRNLYNSILMRVRQYREPSK